MKTTYEFWNTLEKNYHNYSIGELKVHVRCLLSDLKELDAEKRALEKSLQFWIEKAKGTP